MWFTCSPPWKIRKFQVQWITRNMTSIYCCGCLIPLHLPPDLLSILYKIKIKSIFYNSSLSLHMWDGKRTPISYHIRLFFYFHCKINKVKTKIKNYVAFLQRTACDVWLADDILSKQEHLPSLQKTLTNVFNNSLKTILS